MQSTHKNDTTPDGGSQTGKGEKFEFTPDFIPDELKKKGLFCLWKYEKRAGSDKPTKVPYNARTGGKSQSTNPDTFGTYAEAIAAYKKGGYNGIGVGVFGNLAAIDIDHCVDDNMDFSPLANDIVNTMHCYTEISPSGHGLRLLFAVPENFSYDKKHYYINNQKIEPEIQSRNRRSIT